MASRENKDDLMFRDCINGKEYCDGNCKYCEKFKELKEDDREEK